MKRLAVITLLLFTIIMMGCVTTPAGNADLTAAAKTYRADSAAYKLAGDWLGANQGRMTAQQRADFQTYQHAEITAANNVEISFAAWTATGAKPIDFDTLYATLKSAQQKVIDLNTTVNGKVTQ